MTVHAIAVVAVLRARLSYLIRDDDSSMTDRAVGELRRAVDVVLLHELRSFVGDPFIRPGHVENVTSRTN